MKTFTRYDAEHHDPATRYVLAEEAENVVERLRMQLVACGVVAMANTPESAARARDMHPDYMSASCQDVMRRVDSEMTLRAERDALAVRVKELELTQYGSGRLEALRTERDDLQRQLDLERLRHAATRAELEAAPSYPVENPANPLLTVESGGIRYVLETMSDADGDWFEVKSATPTEAMDLETFTVLPMCVPATCRYTAVTEKAREALRQWREEHQRDI